MDKTLNTLTNIVIIFGIVLVIGSIMAGVIWYVRKNNRKKRGKDYSAVDYSSLTRSNTKDFIKIDDILDNVIVTNNWTRFIGIIECTGIDFYDYELDEQLMVAKNYQGFINTINSPITYRLYCSSADLDDTMDRYKESLANVYSKIDELLLQIDSVTAALETTISDAERASYNDLLTSYHRQLSVLDFRQIHLVDQLNYITRFSGNNVAPILTETYVFDWSTDKIDTADMMTKEEIFKKAKDELDTIAYSKIHAIAATGVLARRCTTQELIDMNRHHSLPISSERFKKRNIDESGFDADIISSDTISKYEEKIRQKQKNSANEIIDNIFDSFSFEKE